MKLKMIMRKIISVIMLAATVLMLNSCMQQNAALKSKSGLYGVTLQYNYKIPLDAYWVSNLPIDLKNKEKCEIFIAPLNIDLIDEDYAITAESLRESMARFMHEDLNKIFKIKNKKNKINWHVTDKISEAELRLDIAVVKFKPQHPILKFISTVGGYFIPIPGVSTVADYIAAGDIEIEGIISDAKTKKLYFAFKDKNRKAIRIYNSDAYSNVGAAEGNLRYWSKFIAEIIFNGNIDSNGTFNLKTLLDKRTNTDRLKNLFESSI